MVFEMTVQVRVTDMKRGIFWYETLLGKPPECAAHEDVAEWEILPGCWLQVIKGEPAKGSGPIRLGVTDIEAERQRVESQLQVEPFDIHTREELSVKWGTFTDPWGNRLGFFQYLNQADQDERIKAILANESCTNG
ncbi:VOC family protein [Paenibacillus sp. SC116]|uniref:VOC family protein n=1 Tax=Paenibacillus sp. SC116 TaxID=2968986 RepID=UPI00215A24B8|nr:VOC family protein [Paenibacillus sp. SC116]MCR8845386.1 VOC family protein [Paenibacillus sp. SC116]